MKLFRHALPFARLGIIGAALLAGCAKIPPAPVLGPAPAWKLKDVDGNVVSSDQLKGKVVVIDFWATWCAPCRSEMPGYVKLQKKYGKDGLVIVGVDYGEEPSKVKPFIEAQGITYQIVMGDDQVQAAFGGLDVIPTTFLIDRNGMIRDHKIGARPTDEYEKTILKVLNEKGPKNAGVAG